MWKSSRMYLDPESFFSQRQYLIGDSAFENSKIMVSAYKKPKGLAIPQQHAKFNEKLASMRIISEHSIGMLKGRFTWLRSIRLKIKENRRSLKVILQLLKATIVLHNLLIAEGEEERQEWIDEDDFSDFDDAERAPQTPGDALFEPIPDGARNDEKRLRLMHYFEEHYIF
jgi:DDE superfamily endonuclease